jgi:hypothetical protein
MKKYLFTESEIRAAGISEASILSAYPSREVKSSKFDLVRLYGCPECPYLLQPSANARLYYTHAVEVDGVYMTLTDVGGGRYSFQLVDGYDRICNDVPIDAHSIFTQPNYVGTPTPEKLRAWLHYRLKEQEAKKKIDEDWAVKKAGFLAKLDEAARGLGLKVYTYRSGLAGSMEAKGLEYTFAIDDSCARIEQKIEVSYGFRNLESFINFVK